MDSSNSLLSVPLSDLFESYDGRQNDAAYEAADAFEALIRQLRPLLKHVAVPVTISPYGHSSGPVTWFGKENPNLPLRAVEIARHPWFLALLLDEKGKLRVVARCPDGTPGEYHGNREFYGKGRKFHWHDFILGEAISGLLSVLKNARERREQHLQHIKDAELVVRQFWSKLLAT